jgi:hypothetical protein
MTVNVNPQALKAVLDQATGPTEVMDAFRALGIGTILRNLPTYLRGKSPGAAANSPYDLAANQTLILPDDAKAAYIISAYGRVGGVTATSLAVQAYAATPSTGQIAVAPSGNIALLGTDLWTNMDVLYIPAKVDPVELILPVVPGTGVCALPITTNAQLGGGGGPQPTPPGGTYPLIAGGVVVMLMEAEALAGTTKGKEIILVEATSAPSTGHANLDLPKANVRFATADAVTSARIKLGVAPLSQFTGVGTPDVDALLEALAGIL